jgi:hypothetical protein
LAQAQQQAEQAKQDRLTAQNLARQQQQEAQKSQNPAITRDPEEDRLSYQQEEPAQQEPLVNVDTYVPEDATVKKAPKSNVPFNASAVFSTRPHPIRIPESVSFNYAPPVTQAPDTRLGRQAFQGFEYTPTVRPPRLNTVPMSQVNPPPVNPGDSASQAGGTHNPLATLSDEEVRAMITTAKHVLQARGFPGDPDDPDDGSSDGGSHRSDNSRRPPDWNPRDVDAMPLDRRNEVYRAIALWKNQGKSRKLDDIPVPKKLEDGDRDKGEAWIRSIELYMHLQRNNKAFKNTPDKIIWCLAYLGPMWSDWANLIIEGVKHDYEGLNFSNWNGFIRHCRDSFGDNNRAHTARVKIDKIRQNGRPPHIFAAEFAALIPHAEMDRGTVWAKFMQAMDTKWSTQIMNMNPYPAETFEAWRDAMFRAERVEEHKRAIARMQRQAHPTQNHERGVVTRTHQSQAVPPVRPQPSGSYQQRYHNGNRNNGNSQNVNAVQSNDKPKDMSQVECYSCGLKGHYARNCKTEKIRAILQELDKDADMAESAKSYQESQASEPNYENQGDFVTDQPQDFVQDNND